MPDIDIDFEDTRREKVIQYVQDKYGDLHVSGIVTFGHLLARLSVVMLEELWALMKPH